MLTLAGNEDTHATSAEVDLPAPTAINNRNSSGNETSDALNVGVPQGKLAHTFNNS